MNRLLWRIARGCGLIAALLAIVCAGSASAAYDEATSYQQDAGHTGFASGGSLGAPPLQQAWSLALGGTLSAPLIGDGMTFVVQSGTDTSPTLFGIDTASGTVAWSRPTGESSSIAYDNGEVFVTDAIGDVVAVDATTGRRLWADALARPGNGPWVVSQDGVLYVDAGGDGGGLYAINETDGSERWLSATAGGTLYADGRFVYEADDDTYNYAFDQLDGRRAWGRETPCAADPGWGTANGAWMILGESLCDAQGATEVVDATTSSLVSEPPEADGGAIAGPTLVAENVEEGSLQATDVLTGAQDWEVSGSSFDTPPLIVNDVVYEGTANGFLHAYNLDTGAAQWTATLGPPGQFGGSAGMAAAEGMLLVPYNGTLVAYSGGTVGPGQDLQIESGPDGPTDATSATFTFGSSDPAAPTSCRLGDGAWQACVSPFALTNVGDGPHMFEVRTTDAGGATVALAARGWSVLSAPPAASFTMTPPPIGNGSGDELAWTASDSNTTFECSLDGAPFAACGSYWPSSSFPDGEHTFSVASVDELGDVQSPPTTVSWTESSTAPTTTLSENIPDYTGERSATFTFSADKPVTFQCSLDGAAYQPCASPDTVSGLADGAHTFSVEATDAYGNVEHNPPSFFWTVDTSTPVATFVSPTPSGTTTDRNPEIAFAASYSATFTCSLDGAPFTNCYSPVKLQDLGYGSHSFRVVATGVAGTSGPTAERDWTIDETTGDEGAGALSGKTGSRPSSAGAIGSRSSEGARGDQPDADGYDEATSVQETAGHTGFASGGSLDAPPLVPAWQLDLGGTMSAPLIGGGDVFVLDDAQGSPTWTLDAIDSTTGTLAWSQTVNPSQMAYDDGMLFVYDDTGLVTAFDGLTGAVLWTHQLPASWVATPVAAGGTLYVNAEWINDAGSGVYALDELTGSTKWATHEYGNLDLAFDGGLVYGADGGSLGTFDASSGQPAWTGGTECAVPEGEAAVDGARAFAGGGECGAAVDTANGSFLDSAPYSDEPAIAGNTGVFLNGSVLQGRDLAAGQLLWQFSGDGTLEGPPLIVNDTAYVTSLSGNLFAVDLDTGAEEWSIAQPGSSLDPATASPGLAAAEGVLVSSYEGVLAAYRSVTQRPGLDLQIDSGPNGATTQTSASFTFAASDPTVPTECQLDDGAWATCTSPYSVSDLPDGPHTFSVRTIDSADGSTIALATQGWSVLTVAPTAQITSAPPTLGHSATATFAFDSSDPNATFQCSLDGAPFAACGGSGSGSVEETVSDGSHTFAVRAVGELGAVQASPATAMWTVDTTQPVTTLSANVSTDTRDQSATFTFEANEQATFACTLDANPPVPCTSPYTVSGLQDGNHTFSVQAMNDVGNTGAFATFAWTVRTVPPVTTFVTAPGGTTTNGPVRFYFTTADPASTFTCSLDGGQFSPCTPPLTLTGLSDGPHSFRVIATDGAGNVETPPAEVDWTFLPAPPANPPTTTIDSDVVSGSSVTVSFHSDETVTFRCSLDSGQWLPCASPVTYSNLSAGDHEVSVQGSNSGGMADIDPATVSFTISPPSTSPEPTGPTPAPPPTTTVSPPTTSRATAPTMSARSLVRGLESAIAVGLHEATSRQLRHGLSLLLGATGPSTVTVTLRERHHKTILAKASRTFRRSGVALAVLHLTRAGRRILGGHGRTAVKVTVTLTAPRTRAVSAAGTARVR